MTSTEEKNTIKTNKTEKLNQNNNQYYQNEEETTMPEKKIIVYLIILALILLFIALFFIYNIIDRGVINTKQTTSITYPDNNITEIDNGDNNNTNNDNQNNNQNNNKDNNQDNNQNNDENNNQNEGGNDNDPVHIIEEDASLKIFEGTKQWSELKELNIFDRDHMHVAKGKIAPGVQDTYTYTVECYGDYKMLYNMVFSDDNPHKINMIYKLKRNGQYVAGDDNTWVKVDQLSQSGMTIAPGTIDVFTLEWRWEDAENDTEIGETDGAKYVINIKSDAEAITNN
ncbi:MAG: hypothetical protein IJ890_06525 [Clostridia bacterium]|nr:hypothetical protein [Clostridia bacterium]